MKYNGSTCTVELTVRELCALVLKSGDLNSKRGTRIAECRSADIYERLQRDAGGYYTSDTAVVSTVLFNGIYYTVSGSVSGIVRTEKGIFADEVTAVGAYEFFAPPSELFTAVLKCHAYFIALQDGLDAIDGRITYFNTKNEKLRYFRYSFTKKELEEYYLSLLERVEPFARIEATRELDVLPAAATAVFPYSELRSGQELMIKECYGAVKRGKRLFVEAPTGTGKTISSLFGAVRALGEKKTDKIFYLTAKASVRREAYSACARLFGTGIGLRAVVLNAKENMCLMSGECSPSKCEPDSCPYARGYYGRQNAALLELLGSGNGYPTGLVTSVAQKYSLCPYELSLDLSEYCDVVICDYNYAFDPSVYLRRYFSDGQRGEKYTFLIDEAHNLADRARQMYSAVLCSDSLEAVAARVEETAGELGTALEYMRREFLRLRRLCRDSVIRGADGIERGFFMSRSPLGGFCETLEKFRRDCETWLRKNRESEPYNAVWQLCASVRKYLCVNEFFDKGFLCYVELEGNRTTVKTYCLDPSSVMNCLLSRAASAVMFSATLTPTEYFCDVLGCRGKSASVTLPSPFDSGRLKVAVADFVSTRYEDRRVNAGKLAAIIAASVAPMAGNYIVYFPSYDCLEAVRKLFVRKYPNVSTVVQRRDMHFSEREEFLSHFKADSGSLRVGFCVLGGAFSEGIDLPGSRLIGVIVIGVGLPRLSNERNIIKEHYDGDNGRGYDYAYTYPGMNNVLQAAGRVIRTDSDRGIVVLVDDRYALPQYRQLFPKHWKKIQYAGNVGSLAEILRRFWQNGQ